MNETILVNPLIVELLADPVSFRQRGRTHPLLKEYFAGLPVETLRPLLAHADIVVNQAAIWVASELGNKGCTLLDDVIPLMRKGDRYLTYHVLEVVVVCAIGDNVDRFILIPQALGSDDDVIRTLAMRLLARSDQSQLEGAVRLAGSIDPPNDVHQRGLSLLATCESRDPEDVRRMLTEDEPFARIYGAIAAKRLRVMHPDLQQIAAELADKSVSRFAREPL